MKVEYITSSLSSTFLLLNTSALTLRVDGMSIQI